MARQRAATNTWRKKKWQAKCGATRCHITVAIGGENRDGEKKCEGELENEVTEGNVGAGMKIAWWGVHAKIDTWVIHHP